MNNLTKFFVAVVALFVGISCATDATEDLTQQVVGDGQTTITVSTGDGGLRTSLGEKVGDEYQVLWSKGDILSLNGTASSALGDITENPTSATFTWSKTFEPPFFLAYPATETNNTVEFAAIQTYVNGTFASNVVPMYGYADASGVESLQLHHLAGVLRIGVYAVEKTSLLNVYVEDLAGAPLAGVFNCSNDGVLTPTDDVKKVVSYGTNGVVLSQDSAAPTYLHIVVPAGAYESLSLTFITDKGVMASTVKAGDGSAKGAIEAGVVREFNSVQFNPESNVEFEIKDEATLKEFKTALDNGTPGYGAARVTADFTVENWTEPIAYFAGVLDGGEHTISGLKAPLFGELHGVISNLTVEVNIATTTNGDKVGAFARRVGVGKLLKCTSKGSIEFSATGTSATHIGGLFGSTLGTGHFIEVKECNNYCNLKISNKTNCNIYIGGLTGYISKAAYTDCHNYGSITFDATNGSTTTKNLYMGGIIGSNQGVAITLSNCTNHGTITTTSKTTNKVYVRIGGILGHTNQAVIGEDLINNGVISLESSAPRYWCGGIVGWFDKTSPCDLANFDNCINNGSITLAKAGTGVCYIGGCLGCVESNASGKIKNFHNTGNLDLNSGQTSVRSRRMFVGGVVGYVSSGTNISYCSNTGNVIAPNYKYSTDIGTFIGLLLGNRYYHTGSDGVSTPMISKADHCYITGTIKRYKVDKSGNEEVAVDTPEELYKFAFGEQNSYEGDEAPTKYITNCSATDPSVAQMPSTEE